MHAHEEHVPVQVPVREQRGRAAAPLRAEEEDTRPVLQESTEQGCPHCLERLHVRRVMNRVAGDEHAALVDAFLLSVSGRQTCVCAQVVLCATKDGETKLYAIG